MQVFHGNNSGNTSVKKVGRMVQKKLKGNVVATLVTVSAIGSSGSDVSQIEAWGLGLYILSSIGHSPLASLLITLSEIVFFYSWGQFSMMATDANMTERLSQKLVRKCVGLW